MDTIASFDVIPPDDILNAIFEFSETGAVNEGWVEMNSDSRSLISNLGTFFLIICLNLIMILVELIVRFMSKGCPWCIKLSRKIAKDLYFGAFLLLGVEGYLDFALGCGA